MDRRNTAHCLSIQNPLRSLKVSGVGIRLGEGHIDSRLVSSEWEKVEGEHINLLKLGTGCRSLIKFQEELLGTTVIVQSDD